MNRLRNNLVDLILVILVKLLNKQKGKNAERKKQTFRQQSLL